MRTHAHVSSTLAILATALGCGGGGGSSSSGAPIEITIENSPVIASEVLSAIMITGDLSTIGGALFGGEVFPSAAGAAGEDEVTRGLAAALEAALALEVEPPPSLPHGAITPSAPFDPFTEDCDVEGEVTISGNIAGSEPTPGDRINARFDECVNLDDDGYSLPALDGRLAFTITALTGDVDALFSLVLALTFDELVSGTGMEELKTHGSVTTLFQNTMPPTLFSTAEGDSVRFTNGAGDSLTVHNIDTLLEQDTDADQYDLFGDGEVSSSAFPGRAVYEIDSTLKGDAGGEAVEHPGAGRVEVTGDDTRMLIDVEDETNVTLYLDLDEDGISEEVLPMTWADLGF